MDGLVEAFQVEDKPCVVNRHRAATKRSCSFGETDPA
jgi:hypothetical protein